MVFEVIANIYPAKDKVDTVRTKTYPSLDIEETDSARSELS